MEEKKELGKGAAHMKDLDALISELRKQNVQGINAKSLESEESDLELFISVKADFQRMMDIQDEMRLRDEAEAKEKRKESFKQLGYGMLMLPLLYVIALRLSDVLFPS